MIFALGMIASDMNSLLEKFEGNFVTIFSIVLMSLNVFTDRLLTMNLTLSLKANLYIF